MAESKRGLYVRLQQQKTVPLNSEIHCAPGELIGLIGPSGGGKTTLLRMIAGLAHPTEGQIYCNGETWLDTRHNTCLSPQHRRIGFVFQDYALFPHMTVSQNIETALLHLPKGERRDKASTLIDMVNLSGLENQWPRCLSGGQRQRVALARALARDPAVLLMDEPFSAVDQVTRRKLQYELVLLRQRIELPIILVTHDLNDAMLLADRIYAISHGVTLQNGPPMELMCRPDTAAVARLMDIQNIFEGQVVDQDEDNQLTRVKWLDYELQARWQPAFKADTRVNWVIIPSFVILHRRERPSRGERENPVQGVIGKLVVMGEDTLITMWVNGQEKQQLSLTVSSHVAQRNRLAKDVEITVSLLQEGVHLMPLPGDTETQPKPDERHG